MRRASISISGTKELRSKLARIGNYMVYTSGPEVLTDSARFLRDRMKEAAPKDTGALASAIDYTMQPRQLATLAAFAAIPLLPLESSSGAAGAFIVFVGLVV